MGTTVSAKPAEVKRDWFVVDADGKTLGRLASEVAHRLRGKHKPTYTPHVDTGDYIVIINAEKIRVTGNKAKDKMYYRSTGYVGNLKSTNFEELIAHTLDVSARNGLAKSGQRIVVTAGFPFSTPGTTNIFHIITVQ